MSDTDYLVGETARIEALITDIDGAPLDPPALRLRLLRPDRSTDDITGNALIKDGAGSYHYDLPLTAHGRWYYRWDAGTPPTGAGEGTLNVQPSRFPS